MFFFNIQITFSSKHSFSALINMGMIILIAYFSLCKMHVYISKMFIMDDKMEYDLEGGGWPCSLKDHFDIDSN